MGDRIPDDAIVIRGGRNLPVDLRRGTGTHPSGTTGVSVESAADISVEELAAAIPHNQVGLTNVRAIRAAGGDVIRTSGSSRHHATLIGLSADVASQLLTPTILHPRKKI